MNRLPDKVSAVTVSQPVDGRKNRRPVRKRKAGAPKPKATHITVDPRVMAAAKRARRHGQRLVIVDAETVRLVNS
jgi:hypothetical protein